MTAKTYAAELTYVDLYLDGLGAINSGWVPSVPSPRPVVPTPTTPATFSFAVLLIPPQR